jgi:hypothetical protein
MAMRDLATGGACNVGSDAVQRAQNPFMRMMDQMLIGNAQNMQRIPGVMVEQQGGDLLEQQMKERQAMMQNMQGAWGGAEEEVAMQRKMMEGHFMQEKIAYEQ